MLEGKVTWTYHAESSYGLTHDGLLFVSWYYDSKVVLDGDTTRYNNEPSSIFE